jgi:hypothetical protein
MTERFASEPECRYVLATVERESKGKNGMATLYGICVPANVVR